MVNWSEWQSDLVGKSMLPYENILGVFAWVLIFTGVIGYVYLKQQSWTAAAISILIILTAFSNYLFGVDMWVNLLTVIMCLAFTGLMVLFISKRRN